MRRPRTRSSWLVAGLDSPVRPWEYVFHCSQPGFWRHRWKRLARRGRSYLCPKSSGVLNHLIQVRVVKREQRPGLQEPHEEGVQTPRSRASPPGKAAAPPRGFAGWPGRSTPGRPARSGRASASPGPGSPPNNQPRLPLALAKQQHEERQEEMKEAQGRRHPLPAATRSAQVPGNLFRQVAAPDDQVLQNDM